MSPYNTPAIMSKNSVSQSGDLTKAQVFLYIIIIAFIISLGIPYASRTCSIFDRSMESNAFEKSTKMITAGSFCFTPSIIRLNVNIWAVVDLFSLKPF